MATDSNINEKSGCCTSQVAEELTGDLVERQDKWITNV